MGIRFAGFIAVAGHDGADGLDQLPDGIGFDQVSIGAGGEGGLPDGFFMVHGEADDADGGAALFDFAGGLQAAEGLHPDVEKNHIRPQSEGLFDGGTAIADIEDDLDVRLRLQQIPEGAANGGMVIGEQDADGRARIRG